MSFNDIEISDDDGRPIFLYSFALGAATFRFTSSDKDVTLNGYKWRAIPISDEGIRISGDATTDVLNITAPYSIAPVAMFSGTPPSSPVIVSIFRYHEGDTEAVLSYTGEVVQVEYPEPGTVRIMCDALAMSMQRDGLRFGWQRNCPYALYDEFSCRVDKTAFAVPGKVINVRPGVVDVEFETPKDTGWFNGGFLEWEHPHRGLEMRTIETHVGTSLQLFGLSDGLYFGLHVVAYPGCARDTYDCTNRFNNLDNYGGVPDMPGKSPFDGDPVF